MEPFIAAHTHTADTWESLPQHWVSKRVLLKNKSFTFCLSLSSFSPLNVLIGENYLIVESSVFVPSFYELDFNCMNWRNINYLN